MEKITCKKCGKEKEPKEFHNHIGMKSGKDGSCASCRAKENKEASFQKRYGITVNDYLKLYSEQKGCCAICNILLEILDVDHCHQSKIVRGLLCNNCNRGIGFFKDNPIFLRKAAEYLEKERPEVSLLALMRMLGKI